MKIVGVANDKTFLCEVSVGELDLLCGTGMGWYTDLKHIGKQFDIRNAWRLIEDLQGLRGELPKMANKLRALADLLEPIAVEIPSAEVPDEA